VQDTADVLLPEVQREDAPEPLGLAASFGFGDRLGLATIGQLEGLSATGANVVPVLAQQSARELERTGRTFEDVLAAAVVGARRSGWSRPFGADADHLKTTADVEAAVAAGFTMFTLDPSDEVVDDVVDWPGSRVRAHFEAADWSGLEATAGDLLARHTAAGIELAGLPLQAEEEAVARAAVKYGRAIVRVGELAARVPRNSDLEVSVDETATPTTTFEHVFVTAELARMGVRPTSLAPRFPGEFEKAIEYRGSVSAFTEAVRDHAAVAAALGPYKLSLHSGSDKLSIYRAFADATGGCFHIKTSGTWYLEALRVAAIADPSFARLIWRIARRDFPEARRSYDISAELEAAPPAELSAEGVQALVEDDAARQILHVTYGSILGEPVLRAKLLDMLTADGGAAYERAVADRVSAHLRALSG
jgi:tagaturonate epimerase